MSPIVNQPLNYKTISFSPLCVGPFSLLGSSAIIYNILSDHQRRFTSAYFRILFGLSLADIIFVCGFMTSTFLDPKGTPGMDYAVGNQATCEAMAFIRHIGAFTQPLYTASLSMYYLLVIKYSKSDDFIRSKIEVWMHVVSWGYPLIGAIVCLSLGLFNTSPRGCRIAAYPLYCDVRDKKTCIRGADASIYRWIFVAVPTMFAFSVVVICMGIIVLHVRKRERIMNRRFSFRNAEISRSRSLIIQYKAVMTQASLYIGTFILVWACPAISMGFKVRPKLITILIQIFWPLQGLGNALIYFWPRFIKTKQENSDKSLWWVLKDMIFTTTLAKEQRRAVVHAVRRRKSAAAAPSTLKMSPRKEPMQLQAVLPGDEIEDTVPRNREPLTVTFGTDNVNEVAPDMDTNDIHLNVPYQPISSLVHEPLDRLRHMRKEIARVDGSLVDGSMITEESTIQAIMQVREMCDDDSIGSTH